MESNITIGQRIAARRRALKLTQDQLAQSLGVTAQAVSKWEHDQSCPDISILPQLAQQLGITTDILLGVVQEEPTVHTAEPMDKDDTGRDEPGIFVEVEGDPGRGFNIHFDSPPVRANFTAAAWLITMGLLLFADLLLRQGGYTPRDGSLGFWSAMWISALMVWGIAGMLRRIRLSNVLLTAAGVYFALNGLDAVSWPLQWNFVIPILLLTLGVCLAVEGARNKNRRGTSVPSGIFSQGSGCILEDGWLEVRNSFGENHFRVETPLLRGGAICNSFGEQVVDFSGAEALDPDCRLTVEGNYGEITLLVPRRYRANYVTSKNFASVDISGQPYSEPEGVLNFTINMNFGDLEIRYI